MLAAHCSRWGPADPWGGLLLVGLSLPLGVKAVADRTGEQQGWGRDLVQRLASRCRDLAIPPLTSVLEQPLQQAPPAPSSGEGSIEKAIRRCTDCLAPVHSPSPDQPDLLSA